MGRVRLALGLMRDVERTTSMFVRSHVCCSYRVLEDQKPRLSCLLSDQAEFGRAARQQRGLRPGGTVLNQPGVKRREGRTSRNPRTPHGTIGQP